MNRVLFDGKLQIDSGPIDTVYLQVVHEVEPDKLVFNFGLVPNFAKPYIVIEISQEDFKDIPKLRQKFLSYISLRPFDNHIGAIFRDIVVKSPSDPNTKGKA